MTGDVWAGVCVCICVCLSLCGCILSIRILILFAEWGHFGWFTTSKVGIRVGIRVGVVDMVHVKSWIMYYVIMAVSTKIEI